MRPEYDDSCAICQFYHFWWGPPRLSTEWFMSRTKRKYCLISTWYFVGLFDMVTFYQFLFTRSFWWHLVMLIIRDVHVINVQSWTYLLNEGRSYTKWCRVRQAGHRTPSCRPPGPVCKRDLKLAGIDPDNWELLADDRSSRPFLIFVLLHKSRTRFNDMTISTFLWVSDLSSLV